MTREKLALQVARAMYTDCGQLESFKAYQCVKAYFLDHEMADLIGIAERYGIVVTGPDGT